MVHVTDIIWHGANGRCGLASVGYRVGREGGAGEVPAEARVDQRPAGAPLPRSVPHIARKTERHTHRHPQPCTSPGHGAQGSLSTAGGSERKRRTLAQTRTSQSAGPQALTAAA
eukprot:3529650-Rhodomonas_salina.3